jgi:phospho-N-acetylmuramoyl-pentapeptide-transferase
LNLSISTEDLKGFWIALAISALSSFPIMKLLAMMKSKQTVSVHAPAGHQVKQGTPTMGGLIILTGVFGTIPFLSGKLTHPFELGSVSMIPITVLMVLFAVIGFVDDFVVPKLMVGKRGLGWKQKILMQVVAAIVPLYMAGYTSPMMIGYGTFIILFFANAYNFSDGLDGLAGTLLIGLLVGMVGLSSGPIAFNTNGFWTYYVPTILFVFLGAVIPFLFWNAPKAKVFMGDVGSLPIGAFLGGFWFLQKFEVTESTASSLHKSSGPMMLIIGLTIWSLMMVAELVPVPLQIASVKLRKKKLFPYTPIHHAFEKAGWPETRVVFVFALLQLIFSMAAISIIAFVK